MTLSSKVLRADYASTAKKPKESPKKPVSVLNIPDSKMVMWFATEILYHLENETCKEALRSIFSVICGIL